ncbi:hypothetical protein FALBO_2230 [Fusarium albosuccineum]|uniref:Lysine-specific metallo-endopeptidase domain-containing protein n=1 Tax=Fusarium albosuccineum TaxID=1237068 RepID=A0A8H4LMK3_9HYPO|nr:hypothetical protein FALBO_2230 [Fusarium albosuccineum]
MPRMAVNTASYGYLNYWSSDKNPMVAAKGGQLFSQTLVCSARLAMRTINLFKSLLGFLAFGQCRAAVSWTTIGCDNVNVDGASIDAIWDSAVAMASNAQSTIDTLVNAKAIMPKSTTSRVADNAKYMWGLKFGFSKVSGLDSASKDRLSQVSSVYAQAEALMPKNSGFLICSGESLTWGVTDDFMTGVWHAKIPGTDDSLVLLFSAGHPQGAASRPCTDGETMGRTFRGQYVSNGKTEEVVGILLCTNQISNDWKGALSLGYSPGGSDPNPNDYKSAAGTALHEMIHAVDMNKYLDQTSPHFGEGKVAYGFNRCYYLAMTEPKIALMNPDNYRVFAEMCMSPATRWVAPKVIDKGT